MPVTPNYYHEERPWGSFTRFTLNEPTTVKILSVNAGEEFSLQTHEKRDEFWRVIGGEGAVTVGDEVTDAKVGDEFFVPRGTMHRAGGGPVGIRILEVSFGDADESDVKRLEDRYGRT